jgi:hypothetical protein
MTPPQHDDRHTTVNPERLARVVEDALESIELRLLSIERRLPTEAEAAAIRVLIESDARVRWLWSTARTWAIWVTAIVAGATVGFDALKTVLKRLIA